MHGGWVVFVSKRHFRTRRKEKGHTASLLSVSGIAAGVMTLVAVLAVMNGFQIGTIENILEINSYHLRVEGLSSTGEVAGAAGSGSGGTAPDSESGAAGSGGAASDSAAAAAGSERAVAGRLENVRGVGSAIPFHEIQTLARGFYSEPESVALRGLPADVLARDPGFAESLEVVSGSFDLERPGTVVLGAELSRMLGVGVGETVTFVNLGGEDFDVSDPAETELEVTGLFRTGFLDYDRGWGFVSLEEAGERFAADDEPVWGIKLENRFNDRIVAARLEEALPDGASVLSWREFNRSIFGALRLEKTLMMLLVGLIFVVVGVNIYQSLRRSVVERTEEIAVLKALGAPPRSIRTVFTLEGLMIGLLGGVLGVMLGLLVSENVNELFALAERLINAVGAVLELLGGAVAEGRFTIFSPAYFYIEEVPTRAVLWETIGIFLFAVVSATVAAHFASLRVARIKPSEILRNE
ncbi:MAG: ABC transporter permease [Spirochaetota bacterium]